MKYVVTLALFTALGGCGKNSTQSDGGGGTTDDMAMTSVEQDLGSGDMAMTGGAVKDMVLLHDLDNHVNLAIPPVAVPLTVDGGVDYYEMHVKPGQQQVLPGAKTTVWGFNGIWPGPTIIATLGRRVAMRVFNELPVVAGQPPDTITIHNHGHNVQAAFDGHPSNNTIPQTTPTVSSYRYEYPNMQQGGTAPNLKGAGTYFFHDHEMGLTGLHFYMGMAAFYIIHPPAGSTEAGLNLPSGSYDIPLMIQDRQFNADNSLNYVVNVVNGFQGNVVVVNGTPHPYISVARRKYRFRMLNGSNARRFDLGLSRGTMSEIGTDGGLLPSALTPPKIPLAPAERVEIVIDFAQYKIGDVITLTNDDPFPPPQTEILQFRVTRDETDTSSLPATLNSALPTLPANTRTRTLTFAFDSGNNRWTMNGHTYDPAAFEFGASAGDLTHLGDTETWTLTNSDPNTPHPFHQHLVEFQILNVCPLPAAPGCSSPPPATAIGWKDTVIVPPSSSVDIKMQFYYSANATDPFVAGPFVFHCHNLEHEDHAMMLQQNVSP